MAILKRQCEAIQRIIARNGCIKDEEKAKPYLGKFFDGLGRCYVANPFAIVRFFADVPELNMAVDGDRFNAERFVDEFRDADDKIFEIPSAAELRKIRHEHRKSVGRMDNIIFTNTQEDAPYLNMNYLIDILEAMPKGTSAHYSSYYRAVYFTDSNNVEAILMPINPQSVKEKGYHVHVYDGGNKQ